MTAALKNIGNCGNLRDGTIAVSRRVWMACERKTEGKYRQFAVIVDVDGNVDAFPRDTISGRRATLTQELRKTNAALVGVYSFGRQRTAPVPSEIADDIEAAVAEIAA